MRKNNFLHKIMLALVFLFLYAPIIVLIIFSFNSTKSRSVWTGFSLQWYEKLMHNSTIMNAIYITLLCAIIATVVATVVGTISAVGFFNMKKRNRGILLTINQIPVVNADITMGVSLCLMFVAAGSVMHFKLGFISMLIAHITFDIPYVILSVMPKLYQMDGNLMAAAQDLGCTWFRGFRKVVLPEIMPGIVNGALIAFTMSIDDFIISYFTGGNAQNLSMVIYAMTKKRISPEINAISTILFVAVIVLLLITNLLEARQEKRAKSKIY